MSESSLLTGPGLIFDHVGYAGTHDLDQVVNLYKVAFGGRVLIEEPWTKMPGSYFGALAPGVVRFRGVLLHALGVKHEFHEFAECAPASNHVGYSVTSGDMKLHMRRLSALGVGWFSEEFHRASGGPYEGREWIYGELNGITVEIFRDPA